MKTKRKFLSLAPFLNAAKAGKLAHKKQGKEMLNWHKLTNSEYDEIAAAVLSNYLDLPLSFVVASIQADRMLTK